MKNFKDSLKFAKEIKANDLRFNYTTMNDYFRSPFIPDNQKVLIALIYMKKRFKALDVSNSFIATFLNKMGIYLPVYEKVTKEDKNGEIIESEEIVDYKIIYSKSKIVDGKEIIEPLYTKTAVSDAINKWKKEGILNLNYDYSFNKAMDKPYKYITKRTITFNYDNLRPLLACFEMSSNFYQSLPKRNRKRKLIRQRPFSILDELNKILADMSEELKKKYQTAEGIFRNWCWSISRKYMRSKMSQKPTAADSTKERQEKLENKALRALLEPDEYINQSDGKTSNSKGNEKIRAVFNQMVGNN